MRESGKEGDLSKMKYHRNDFCPCGSGKKYKNCHFGKEDPVVAKPAAPSKPRVDFDDLNPEKADVMSSEYWAKLSKRLPAKMRREYGPLLSQARHVVEYESRQDQLKAVYQAMEVHRHDFEKLLDNDTEFFKQAEALFSEDRFADMRFGSADVQRAFEAVGFPPHGKVDDEVGRTVAKAICFLVNDTLRKTLALKLLLLLPDYVGAERYRDAWIIHDSLDLLAELSEEAVGPFLMTMFLFGFRAWDEQREREQMAMFKELGLDSGEIRKAGFAGAEALIQKMVGDPRKTEALEKFLASHPELHAMTQAQCCAAEDAALKLLEREDAEDLYPSPDETAPWLERLAHRLAKLTRKFPVRSSVRPDQKAVNAMMTALFDVADEMASAVFAPRRIEMLRQQLREWRQRYSGSGDTETIKGIDGALMLVQSGDKTGNSRFLIMLCAHSLRADMGAVSDTKE